MPKVSVNRWFVGETTLSHLYLFFSFFLLLDSSLWNISKTFLRCAQYRRVLWYEKQIFLFLHQNCNNIKDKHQRLPLYDKQLYSNEQNTLLCSAWFFTFYSSKLSRYNFVMFCMYSVFYWLRINWFRCNHNVMCKSCEYSLTHIAIILSLTMKCRQTHDSFDDIFAS